VKLTSLLAFSLTLFALILAIFIVTVKTKLIVIMESFCDKYSVSIKPETTEVDLEVGRGKLVKFGLKNNGPEDEFKISSDGPEWAVTRPEKIRLENNKTDDIFVYLSPDIGMTGDFAVDILVDSFCVHEKETLLTHVV
jgi:hypothetical protein